MCGTTGRHGASATEWQRQSEYDRHDQYRCEVLHDAHVQRRARHRAGAGDVRNHCPRERRGADGRHRSERKRNDQGVAEWLVRGQGKPWAHGENDERHRQEGNGDHRSRNAQNSLPPLAAHCIERQLGPDRECDQRQRTRRDRAQNLQLLGVHQMEPGGPGDVAGEEIPDDARHSDSLRDRSGNKRGERHAAEGERGVRLDRTSDRAHEPLQERHDDEGEDEHQPLHDRAKYGRFSGVTMPFVHLHTHSEYSLLDGANRIPDLLDRVQALGMDSLAITDHGNLHGAWSFYAEAKARKIRPILGFEAYLAFGSRLAREKPAADVPLGSAYSHLVLLAKNRVGYQNLIRLSSIGFLEGYYRRPRIDKEVLERHREGIIGLAACLSGEIALYLRQGNYEAAKASAAWFARTFGPNGFWLEVQNHGIPEEQIVTDGMFRIAAELGLPVAATNDAHYLKKEDAEAHDVLLAIGTGKDLDDPKRFRFFGQESYVKSESEMRGLFGNRTDVLAETARVAELCEFDFEKRYFLPQYPRPAEFASDQDLLVHLARIGAAERYGDPLPDAVPRLRARRHHAHRLRRLFPDRV